MTKYIKAIFQILKNYRSYSIIIIYYEIYYFIRFNNKFNQFKYLKSKHLSDSIPCSFFTLKFIEKNISNLKIKKICDLGSGYGKILFYFGIIKKYLIDGIELDKTIFNKSLTLKNKKINIYNKNILNFNYKIYDLLIINDPLKRIVDFTRLVKKLRNIKKKYLIFINMNESKKKLVLNNFKILNKIEFSSSRNIFFCKNKHF